MKKMNEQRNEGRKTAEEILSVIPVKLLVSVSSEGYQNNGSACRDTDTHKLLL
jgi:hypothetical protein